MTLERLERTARGAILSAAGTEVTDAQFEPEYWRSRGAIEGSAPGRGRVLFVRARPDSTWALRHYHRGGAIVRWLEDRYLFTRAGRTRAFREWRILARLHARGLPVPRPIAARFERTGPIHCTMDLLTEVIPDVTPLARRLDELGAEHWEAIGRTVRRFHDAGVWHADLNARNILLAESAASPEPVYVLDFDRGRIRRPGRWARRNLARLRRSLLKLGMGGDLEPAWRALLRGYSSPA